MNAFAYDCGCNLPHGKTIKTVEKLSELSGIFPSGLKALVLSDNVEFKRAVAKLYRTESLVFADNSARNTDIDCPKDNDSCVDADTQSLSQKDTIKTAPHTTMCIDKQALHACDFSAILSKAKLSEDIRIVISEGEYAALGKAAASALKARHIIVGGSNVSPYDFSLVCGFERDASILEKSVENPCDPSDFKSTMILDAFHKDHKSVYAPSGYKIIQSETDVVLKDTKRLNIPAGFAFVMCASLTLFDWDIASLLFEEKMCNQIFKEAQKIIARLVEAARMLSRRSPQLKAEVQQAQLDMAGLIKTKGARLLLSGATQSAAALAMLYRREEREFLDIHSSAFLLSPTVARAYAAFLSKEIPFAFPPDLNLRADRMSEYLGMDKNKIYPLSPHMDIKKIRLTDYRLSVYREELLKHIYGIIRTLDTAMPLYFRLFEDDGFSLKGYFGFLDSSLSIGLGSDVLAGDTLLSYMRAKGVLDRYIL